LTAENPSKFEGTAYDSYVYYIHCCEDCRRQVPAWERKRRLAAWLPRIALTAGILAFFAALGYFMMKFNRGVLPGLPVGYFWASMGLGLATAVSTYPALYPITRSTFQFVDDRAVAAIRQIGFASSMGPVYVRFPNQEYMNAYKAFLRAFTAAEG
jgi:hypothetical protein